MNRRQWLAASFGAAAWTRAAAQDKAVGSVIDWPRIHLLDGDTIEPFAWPGQAAVLVFWATYCPFCKRHNAHVDKLYRQTRGLPLRVLGVALDSDAEAVRRYMSVNDYQFPVTLDGASLRDRLTPRRVIPMTCVIDRQSRLVQSIPGEMFEEDVLDLGRIAMQRRP